MKKINGVIVGTFVALAGLYGNVQAAIVNLGDPLAATQTAGTWYTDRYAPNGFSYNGGTGVLTETISSSDRSAARPGAYVGSFYDTQGRKHDLDAGTTSMKIDLFIDSSWANNPGTQRIAGLWGTAVNGLNTITGYPILEFARDGTSGPRFQGWNDESGWVNYGLSNLFAYDAWHELKISLDTVDNQWDYILDGTLLGSVAAFGATEIDNVILQGYNKYLTNEGGYDIKWRNLESNPTDIPEPGTFALMGLAGLGLVMTRRRLGTVSKI